MKVLVIGSGGREHALVWKISQSKQVNKIYCAPGNAGTANLAENVDIAADDVDNLLNFVKHNSIDLTIVGPEAPLVLGIVNKFEKAGLKEVIYTDINKDGVLKGPNFEMLKKILEHTTVKLIASGGVSNAYDVENLIKVEVDNKRVFGTIIGKAIYEGLLNLREVADIKKKYGM